MKLYEAFSALVGAKFNVQVGEEKRELSLGKFDLGLIVQYETEDMSVDALLKQMNTKPATISTKLGWDLLIDKEEFNNDINIFRKILTLENIAELGRAIVETIENSKPKNVERVE